jgi:hypothetical protein
MTVMGVLGAAATPAAALPQLAVPDLEKLGAGWVKFEKDDELRNSRLSYLQGKRIGLDGCDFPVDLYLPPGERAIEVRERAVQPSTCLAVVERGVPTEESIARDAEPAQAEFNQSDSIGPDTQFPPPSPASVGPDTDPCEGQLTDAAELANCANTLPWTGMFTAFAALEQACPHGWDNADGLSRCATEEFFEAMFTVFGRLEQLCPQGWDKVEGLSQCAPLAPWYAMFLAFGELERACPQGWDNADGLSQCATLEFWRALFTATGVVEAVPIVEVKEAEEAEASNAPNDAAEDANTTAGASVACASGMSAANTEACTADALAAATRRYRRSAGYLKSFWEDPPQFDVNSVRNSVDFRYGGGCVHNPIEFAANYGWMSQSGWERLGNDWSRGADCASAGSSSFVHFKNKVFCASIDTNVWYNRNTIYGYPNGAMRGKVHSEKRGGCVRLLSFDKKMVRTYP